MRQWINLFCAFVLIQCFTGCKNAYEKEIIDVLSYVKEKYAPDSRIALFDVKFIQDDRPMVKGETNLINAFNELDSILKTDYTEVEFRVELLPTGSMDSLAWGIITVSVANLRPIPMESAELITQAILGTPVKILAKENDWYLIQTPDQYLGWTADRSLVPSSEKGIHRYNRSDRIIFTGLTGMCYTQPDENSLPVSDMVAGSILQKTGENLYFWEVRFPDGRSGFVEKNTCKHFDEWKESCINSHQAIMRDEESDMDKEITETAMRFLGLPYLWGGTSSKGMDCSGFTKTVYFMNGIILQRDASQQVLYGEPIDVSDGYKNLVPGDLIFFGEQETDSTRKKITHVGICIGNGELIHGSWIVRINSLIPGEENYSHYLDSVFICANRILTCIGEPGIEPVFTNEFYK